MKIIVDHGGYALRNLGDLAMLQVAVGRLKQFWPDADIAVFADDAERLQACVPGVRPLLTPWRWEYFGEGALMGPLGHRSPVAERALLNTVWPVVVGLVRLKHHMRGRQCEGLVRVFGAFQSADLVVCTGGGYLTDSFEEMVWGIHATAVLARAFKKPLVLMGQGVGPLERSDLRGASREILTTARLVGLRERVLGVPICKELGVPEGRIRVTGDDALELVQSCAVVGARDALGVNLRREQYAGVDEAAEAVVRSALQECLKVLGVAVVPVAVSHYDSSDWNAVARLVPGRMLPGAHVPATPGELVRQISRCRVVVTGSYHGAIFALGQGIPVVCLSASPYYGAKFAGLQDLYGCEACRVLCLGQPGAGEVLSASVLQQWETAARWGKSLTSVTAKLVASSRAFYAEIPGVVVAS